MMALCLITLCATGLVPHKESVASPPEQEASPSARAMSAQGRALIEKLGALQFKELGHPAVRWDHIPPVFASAERPHQLLVVLVRFPDLGFDRFKGSPDQPAQLTSYYQELLFDPDYKRPNTLSHYFAQQSYGQYHLQGQVLPPITLTHPRAYYGRPKRPEGGAWRNDSDVEGLVEEVLAKVGEAHPDLNWADFDRWDPNDVDQDGELEEADGYLDHLVMVYAGGGQSSCQGLYKLHTKLNPNVGPEVFKSLNLKELECADRIWPHRFMVQRREGQGPTVNGVLNGRGGAPINVGLWARDYNMQSEYTEPSTFIHEFGHSIGLPDVYARSTNNSTGPWELMSSTTSPSPQGLSAWSKVMLGWIKPTVIFPPEADGERELLTSVVTLDTPAHRYEPVVAPAISEVQRAARVVKQEVVKPILEAEATQEASEASAEALGQVKERVLNGLKNSEHVQEGLKAAQVAKEKLKQATAYVKGKIKESPTLSATQEKGAELLAEGARQVTEQVNTLKASLKQLAPTRALLIALPPQPKVIHLTDLAERHGKSALYSGQGNELNRAVTFALNLTSVEAGEQVSLSMDAWWEIEAGWDFAYLEVREEAQEAEWVRLVDPRRMLAKHGHDGPRSKPGFTGRSGDLDGDGKNESSEGCDPKEAISHGEEKTERHPCERSTWSDATFDLSAYAGKRVTARLRYFTDTAAVERGVLIDNVKVSVAGQEAPLFTEDFEGELSDAVKLEGFLLSSGAHSFEVPHFYIVEHRDPYAGSEEVSEPSFRYDSALGRARPIFGYDPERKAMGAVRFKARPGALVWYVNGAYAWSENEPTHNGPGRGFLLAVDANPNEYSLPGWGEYYLGSSAQADTRYELKSEEAQRRLKLSAIKTICFVRSPWSYPRDLPPELLYACEGPQLPTLRIDAKTPMFSYEVINTLLPGEPRDPYLLVSELYDFKVIKGELKWSFRNRALRGLHLLDAPFSSTPFEGGVEYLDVVDGSLKVRQQVAHPAVPRFSDTPARSWLNPHLRFGGVELPSYGLSLDFEDQAHGVEVKVSWAEDKR